MTGITLCFAQAKVRKLEVQRYVFTVHRRLSAPMTASPCLDEVVLPDAPGIMTMDLVKLHIREQVQKSLLRLIEEARPHLGDQETREIIIALLETIPPGEEEDAQGERTQEPVVKERGRASEPLKKALSEESTAENRSVEKESWRENLAFSEHLDERGCAEIILEGAAHQGVAVVLFETVEGERELLIKEGEVLAARRNGDGELPFGAYLVAHQILEVQEEKSLRLQARKEGRSLEEVLSFQEILGGTDLRLHKVRWLRQELQAVLRIQRGTGSLYYPEELRIRARGAVSIYSELISTLRKDIDEMPQQMMREESKRLFGSSLHFELKSREAPLLQKMTREERGFFEYYQTPMNYNDITRQSRLRPHEVTKLLILADKLGFLRRTSADSVASESLDNQKLDALRRQFLHTDPFAAFGLHWSAYDEEVQTTYRDLSRLLNELIERGVERDSVEEIREKVEITFSILSNRDKRRAARQKSCDDFDRRSAEHLYRDKIDTLKIKRDIPALIDTYRRILELRPDDKVLSRELKTLLGA